MESDKILVMDAGRAVEFAPPLALLKLDDGHLTNLLRQTGQDSFDKLKRIAEDYARAKGLDLAAIDVFADPYNIVLDPISDLNLNHESDNPHDVDGDDYISLDSICDPIDSPKVFTINENDTSDETNSFSGV
jgi:hypothetical protein